MGMPLSDRRPVQQRRWTSDEYGRWSGAGQIDKMIVVTFEYSRARVAADGQAG